jgi:hypothetical protein
MHYIGRLLVLLADQHVISAFWWRLAGVGHHSYAAIEKTPCFNDKQ